MGVSHIGLDVGRNGVKSFDGVSTRFIPSVVGEWRDRRLQSRSNDDIEVLFRGERSFVGNLALNESEFWRYMMTDDKAHADTRLLALVAIHRAGLTDDVVVTTGLPVELHTPEAKAAMRNLLLGRWEIEVNGDPRVIRIHDVKVAVEGGGAFWSAPADGLIRVIDAGSKTVNYVTMRNKRYVDRDSGTLPFGFNTNKTDNPRQMTARIAGELGKKWSASDDVRICGGRAEELAKLLRDYFVNARAMANPLYANAIGFYRVGSGTT
ncbi:ParM/StbA family protein [Paenibacillus sediminis]|uniref:Plasmid segregation protein ParM n=1 Tax=Paenibacillus sediminis TaxID=664909 RepID=A0ABS4H6Q1_9BACL|nr:plasmid segregation protein ParM [Paenibacillus sediminis]